MSKHQRGKTKEYIIFAGIGMELIGIQLAMMFIGRAIDQRMGWPSYAVAGLSLLGLVVWLIHVVKMLKRFGEDEDGSEPPVER